MTVLELTATAEARELLEYLADKAKSEELRREARAAHGRLPKQP